MSILNILKCRQKSTLKVDQFNSSKPSILIIAPFFEPAVLAGGPVRALRALTSRLASEFDFYVLALKHDLGESELLPNIVSSKWTRMEGGYIRYENDRKFNPINYARWIRETRPNVVYIKTFFSVRFCLVPTILVLCMRRNRPEILIAPAGSLMEGALRLKRVKKRIYLMVYKLLGFPKSTHWHVTSAQEFDEFTKVITGAKTIREARSVFLAGELQMVTDLPSGRVIHKQSGELRVLFLSRVSPKKNLAFAIERLGAVSGNVLFTVAGPWEDSKYLNMCQDIARSLPSNVRVDFIGPVQHDAVSELLLNHHLFFLPTFAENFGYSIVESLGNGRPVLISDRTPWRGLEKLGFGFDLPLDQPHAF